MNRKLLLVDDDPNILHGYRRQLRKQFEIETAAGGKEGLEALHEGGPFAVIVSDMRMPEMNGIEFLTSVRQLQPDSVRIMLTGNADQKTAIDAVNDGQIFRFLTKPCSQEDFGRALEAGIEQYRLITAERELLSKTLSGSVSVLIDILSMVNPTAFGRTASVRRLVRHMCRELQIDNAWEIEIAAMLSQIGCVTIPEVTLTKLSRGAVLSADETKTYQRHPQVGHDLIAKIPRLEGVAEIIACQQMRFNGAGTQNAGKKGSQIPLGARILKLAIDVVELIAVEQTTDDALGVLRARNGWYDPRLLKALTAALDSKYVIESVTIDGLEPGMILDTHVLSRDGDILLARGQEVTVSMRERLKRFSETAGRVQEPIRVQCPVYKRLENESEESHQTADQLAEESKA